MLLEAREPQDIEAASSEGTKHDRLWQGKQMQGLLCFFLGVCLCRNKPTPEVNLVVSLTDLVTSVLKFPSRHICPGQCQEPHSETSSFCSTEDPAVPGSVHGPSSQEISCQRAQIRLCSDLLGVLHADISMSGFLCKSHLITDSEISPSLGFTCSFPALVWENSACEDAHCTWAHLRSWQISTPPSILEPQISLSGPPVSWLRVVPSALLERERSPPP